MIDIGFNLLTFAMVKGKSLKAVHNQIAHAMGADDPYPMLRYNNHQAIVGGVPCELMMLSERLGCRTERLFGSYSRTLRMIYGLLRSRKTPIRLLDASAKYTAGGRDAACISMYVQTGNESRMTVLLDVDDITSKKMRLIKLTVHYWIGGDTFEFNPPRKSVNSKEVIGALRVFPSGQYLLQGIKLVHDGPNALAKRLFEVRKQATVYYFEQSEDANGRATLLEFRAEFPHESYEATRTYDDESTWHVNMLWADKLRCDVTWPAESDLAMQLAALDNMAMLGKLLQMRGEVPEPPRQVEARQANQALWNKLPGQPEIPQGADDITHYRPYKRATERVHVGDLVVRSTVGTCNNPNHDILEVVAVVCVLSMARGVVEVAVDAFCCKECKRYFILDQEYDRLVQKGALCCKVVNGYSHSIGGALRNNAKLSERSFFNALGYNVGQEDNLTSKERRTILDFAIANGFKTQKETIRFLQWLVEFNGRNRGMEEAVKKWKSDIRYLMSSRSNKTERVRIDRIYLTQHKW